MFDVAFRTRHFWRVFVWDVWLAFWLVQYCDFTVLRFHEIGVHVKLALLLSTLPWPYRTWLYLKAEKFLPIRGGLNYLHFWRGFFLATLFCSLIPLFGILISQNRHSGQVQAHYLRCLFVCACKIYIGIFVSRVSLSSLDLRVTLAILSIFRTWVQILHFQDFRCVYTEYYQNFCVFASDHTLCFASRVLCLKKKLRPGVSNKCHSRLTKHFLSISDKL